MGAARRKLRKKKKNLSKKTESSVFTSIWVLSADCQSAGMSGKEKGVI